MKSMKKAPAATGAGAQTAIGRYAPLTKHSVAEMCPCSNVEVKFIWETDE